MQAKPNKGRRSYGTGSLYVKQGAWYGRWRVGDRKVTRKIGPLPSTPGGGLTKALAERELRRLLDEEMVVATKTGLSVVDAAERYVDYAEAQGRKRTTVADYRCAIRVHFGFFGDRALDSIRVTDVEALVRHVRRQGRAVKSIRNWIGLLSGTFNYGRRRGWCAINPCKALELPRVETSDDIQFLSRDELTALIQASADNGRLAATDRVLYLTAAMTGMRQGELLALRWRDIDWSASRIRVRRNYVRGEFGTPKSKRSSRSVPLGDVLAGELERHFQRSDWQTDDDLVFANPVSGKPLGRTKLTKRYKDALKRAGVREIKFHGLRHSFGTTMAAQGVPLRTLMEWMGHRDLKTVQIYADYCPGAKEAQYVDEAFAGVQFGVHPEQTSDDPTEPQPAL
jgi:integrase